MKRILALVLLAVFVSANAFAARVTATFGDQDSAKNYRIQATDDGLITFANDTVIAYPYENITAPASQKYTLSVKDTGSSIVDWGQLAITTSAASMSTTGGNLYYLPSCTSSILGYNYHIATAAQETITVTPVSATDSLLLSVSGTGEAAGFGIKNTSAQAGDQAMLSCQAVGQWAVTEVTGTWANSNTVR